MNSLSDAWFLYRISEFIGSRFRLILLSVFMTNLVMMTRLPQTRLSKQNCKKNRLILLQFTHYIYQIYFIECKWPISLYIAKNVNKRSVDSLSLFAQAKARGKHFSYWNWVSEANHSISLFEEETDKQKCKKQNRCSIATFNPVKTHHKGSPTKKHLDQKEKRNCIWQWHNGTKCCK